MATVLEAPERSAVEHDRTAFNLAVWEKIHADPQLAKLPYRIETDAFGQIIMSPPPAPAHGSKQGRIYWHLRDLLKSGEVITECPISTEGGVKVADVAWCSEKLWANSASLPCFLSAPEICVEVLSPSNTTGEIDEKKELYFKAGAREVWLCAEDGGMTFYLSSAPLTSADRSALCEDFPRQIVRP